MAEMKRVALKDMRPDPKNPRKDFTGIEELAASFAYTPDRPGEPVNPPIVVKDGNVYRIVDGERRYRAMCKVGTPGNECLCIVFDDFGEASSVAAMMATDQKENLSEEERSIGMQQMLILGVPDDTADLLSRSNSGSAAKVRKAIGKADKPVQLRLTTLIDISQIEDAEKRDELMKLSESGQTGYGSDFSNRLNYYNGEQRVHRERVKYMNLFVSSGIVPRAHEPEEDEWSLLRQAWSLENAESIMESLNESSDEWCVYVPQIKEPGGDVTYWSSVCPKFYIKRDEEADASNAEWAARREMVAAFDSAIAETSVKRFGFVSGLVKSGSVSDDSQGYDRKVLRDYMCYSVGRFFKDEWYQFEDVFDDGSDEYRASIDPDINSFEFWQMPIIASNLEPASVYLFEICNDGKSGEHYSGTSMEWEEYFEALVSAGYEPNDFEKDVIAHVSGFQYEEWLGGIR